MARTLWRTERLRRKYEGFRKGGEDALEVIDEARLVLEEIKKKENRKVAN